MKNQPLVEVSVVVVGVDVGLVIVDDCGHSLAATHLFSYKYVFGGHVQPGLHDKSHGCGEFMFSQDWVHEAQSS